MAILCCLASLVRAVFIITILFSVAAFRIASYVIWPFGRSVELRQDAGIASLLGHVIWIVIVGILGVRIGSSD